MDSSLMESFYLPALSVSMTCGRFFKEIFRQAKMKKKPGCTKLDQDLESRMPHLDFHCSTPMTRRVSGKNCLSTCEISPICGEYDYEHLRETAMYFPEPRGDDADYADETHENDFKSSITDEDDFSDRTTFVLEWERIMREMGVQPESQNEN